MKAAWCASDELRPVIENQPRGHFRRRCRQMRTMLKMGLSIMADTSREYSAAGGSIGGFERIVELPRALAHAPAVPVRPIVAYQQAARDDGAAQSAANAAAVAQRDAERRRNRKGLRVAQAPVKRFVQRHDNRFGAQQLPGLIQIRGACFKLCDERLNLRIVMVAPRWHQ